METWSLIRVNAVGLHESIQTHKIKKIIVEWADSYMESLKPGEYLKIVRD